MKFNKIINVLFLFFVTLAFSQEKIGNKIYSYGEILSLQGKKTLLVINIDDPKTQAKIIKEFKKKDLDVTSSSKYIIPYQNKNESEIEEIINSEGYEAVVVISFQDMSTYTQTSGYSTASYSGLTNSINNWGYATTGSVVGSVELLYEFYYKSKGFGKPSGLINAQASNSWGAAGTVRGVMFKINTRVLRALDSEEKL